MKYINLRDAIYNSTGGIFGISRSKFKKENVKLLQLQEFESILTSFVGASRFAEQRYQVLDEKIKEMLRLINQELKE